MPIVIAFKAARLFNPEKVSDLKPTASTIEVFAFLVNVRLNLKAELAEYLSLAGVTKIDILDWWVKNADKQHSWATACKKIVLCQPSSAASEITRTLL